MLTRFLIQTNETLQPLIHALQWTVRIAPTSAQNPGEISQRSDSSEKQENTAHNFLKCMCIFDTGIYVTVPLFLPES